MMRWKVHQGYNTDKPPIDSYSLDKCIFVNVKGTKLHRGVFIIQHSNHTINASIEVLNGYTYKKYYCCINSNCHFSR